MPAESALALTVTFIRGAHILLSVNHILELILDDARMILRIKATDPVLTTALHKSAISSQFMITSPSSSHSMTSCLWHCHI
ncbi:uncharacterized protein K489DRAFT_384301, partial [Dissoconium aciculare CBS 342.82]|uniref:Uncharacterized protein n=1 Tax=Dissoconium aciculare CBS 342.82 TaxID=1314786 RepID=A0A6J3LSP1_9PEZI